MNRIAINIARWALRYVASRDRRHWTYIDQFATVQKRLDDLHKLYFVDGR
jgi:hypothetical protein